MKKIRTQPYHRLLSGPMTVAAIALILLIAVSGCADDATKAENYKARARQFASNGQYRESVLELKNALQINPDDYDAYYHLAEVRRRVKRYAEFKSLCKELVQADVAVCRTVGLERG